MLIVAFVAFNIGVVQGEKKSSKNTVKNCKKL